MAKYIKICAYHIIDNILNLIFRANPKKAFAAGIGI